MPLSSQAMGPPQNGPSILPSGTSQVQPDDQQSVQSSEASISIPGPTGANNPNPQLNQLTPNQQFPVYMQQPVQNQQFPVYMQQPVQNQQFIPPNNYQHQTPGFPHQVNADASISSNVPSVYIDQPNQVPQPLFQGPPPPQNGQFRNLGMLTPAQPIEMQQPGYVPVMQNYADPSPQNRQPNVLVPCEMGQFATVKNRLTAQYPNVDFNYEQGHIVCITDPSDIANMRIRIQSAVNEVHNLQNMKWAWMNESANFVPYPDHICREIEMKYQNNEIKCENIRVNGSTYDVIFGQPHLQHLKNANITRTVRRLDGSDNVNEMIGNQVVWRWQDTDGSFKPYTAEAMRQIELAFNRNLEGTMLQGSNGNAYLINFADMTQFNEKTLYKRKIKKD